MPRLAPAMEYGGAISATAKQRDPWTKPGRSFVLDLLSQAFGTLIGGLFLIVAAKVAGLLSGVN